MAALAELRLLALGHHIAVVTQEPGIVLQERGRHRATQRFGLVTRGALTSIPLLGVLVAGEALAHGRQRRALCVDHARVARDALPANFRHCEVLVVVDRDLAARAHGFDRKHSAHLMRVAMTPLTDRDLRQALSGIMPSDVVTTHTAQTRGLSGHTASNARQVHLMRKALRR